jgi:peptidoglycan/xylan/chitin deacetylase (PgdA/CDA1 family)
VFESQQETRSGSGPLCLRGPGRTGRRPLRRFAARLTSLSRYPASGPSLRILTYHRVNDNHPGDRLSVHPLSFEAQMAYLAENYAVVPLSDAIDELRAESLSHHRAVAVTFDDGYRDNFDIALPIMERNGVSATFFLVSELIGSSRRIARYDPCCDSDQNLDWSQVRELAARGHTLGGHGRTHRELPSLTREEARREIEGCRTDIERKSGHRPRIFCYPRGSESPSVRELVASAGYDASCTVYPGANRFGCDFLALRRTEISGADDLEDFQLKLEGRFDRLHQLTQALQRWGHR